MSLKVANALSRVKDHLEDEADTMTVGASIFVDRKITQAERLAIANDLNPEHIRNFDTPPEARIDL